MAHDRPWQIQIDTGGTFTDCVGIDPQGNRHTAKVLSRGGLRATVSEVIDQNTLRIEHAWEADAIVLIGMSVQLLNKKTSSKPTQVTVADFDAAQSILTISSKDNSHSNVFDNGDTIELLLADEEAPILAARLLTATGPMQPLPAIELRLATTRATNALLERAGSRVACFVNKGFRDLLRIGDQTRPELFELNIVKPPPLTDHVYEVDARMDAEGCELIAFDCDAFAELAEQALRDGATTAAVAFMHSVRNAAHENAAAKILRAMPFEHVAVSSELSPLIKILPRAETTVVDAYVGPAMKEYLQRVSQRLGDGTLQVMTSGGGLKPGGSCEEMIGGVHAFECLLSGPAGGVVGAVAVAKRLGYDKIIGLDMGGTSTDVSRYDGEFQYRYAQRVGDARIMAPALAIETVAAGGGSICDYQHGRLCVGPASAGADPGPACYGRGGPLTLTDVNVLAGRIATDEFAIPIQLEPAEHVLQAVLQKMEEAGEHIKRDELIDGFLAIANQRMADAIEQVSIRQGVDPKEYTLVSFGGAGGQHACAVAELLGIKTIIMPHDASLLSAVGLGYAAIERIVQRQVLKDLDEVLPSFDTVISNMRDEAMDAFSSIERERMKESKASVITRISVAARLKGQGTSLDLIVDFGNELEAEFRKRYQTMYGHPPRSGQVIEIESVRVAVSWKSKETSHKDDADAMVNAEPIIGPAIVDSANSSCVIKKGWTASHAADGSYIVKCDRALQVLATGDTKRSEWIQRELIANHFIAIATEMGELLERTAISTNVKERRDFSCAIFDASGRLLVNAPHVPVHLGGLGLCVRAVIEMYKLQPGDTIITNHPKFGGSHLPDVTLITPVFDEQDRLIAYVANRAHHAEIGGTRPGSMPPNATTLVEEGVIISPVHLVRKGNEQFSMIEDTLRNAHFRSRSVETNLADIRAQLAANQLGNSRLQRLAAEIGSETLHAHMQLLFDQAQSLTERALRSVGHSTGSAMATLDDGWRICVSVNIADGRARIDFSGSSPTHSGNLNATPAIVRSAVIYVFRLYVGEELPLNEAMMEQIDVILPECFLNPTFVDDAADCPAVVGGNTEVSQRLVDALLEALGLAANGPGTMNNLLFGSNQFGYYETIGGGSGAGLDFDGASGVHCHMTNTRMTDSELLEQRYPVRVREFSIREDSGGIGKHRGGDGLYRELEFLKHLSLSVLTQRRRNGGPNGLHGGGCALTGRQTIIRANGDMEELRSIDASDVGPGDRIIVETPGGGGYGVGDLEK